ncbi:hypothetical protein [Bradyrhizobium erythrophlei]|jgi:hypothetical protein|uniref:Uncharacterized protein n=1 Tax=Bradyrhizobium erythrophlei TaxID=1437360 RepID=A0A1M7UJG6_9BRAD|nr:hypothetical protein [Bradyrhizobium erythrophlei]SHN83088.1 hypothetical protein SAMN05444170_5396 [Bradyrhizobium erythrophlei]
MKRPNFSDSRRQPVPASSREAMGGKEGNERDGVAENAQRVPIPMMLIIGALMGGSRD